MPRVKKNDLLSSPTREEEDVNDEPFRDENDEADEVIGDQADELMDEEEEVKIFGLCRCLYVINPFFIVFLGG